MSKPIVLSIRLQMLADAVEPSARIVDVGADHGLLLAYLLEEGRATEGIATDIHAGPAKRAAEYLAKRGLDNRTKVFCTDGLGDISLLRGDTVIVAGMGGQETIHIVDGALSRGGDLSGISFLLQPQKNWVEVRRFLLENGFRLVKEWLCLDREKWYVALRCVRNEVCADDSDVPASLTELYLGSCLVAHPPVDWGVYLRYHEGKLRKIAKGKPEYVKVLEDVRSMIAVCEKSM